MRKSALTERPCVESRGLFFDIQALRAFRRAYLECNISHGTEKSEAMEKWNREELRSWEIENLRNWRILKYLDSWKWLNGWRVGVWRASSIFKWICWKSWMFIGCVGNPWFLWMLESSGTLSSAELELRIAVMCERRHGFRRYLICCGFCVEIFDVW